MVVTFLNDEVEVTQDAPVQTHVSELRAPDPVVEDDAQRVLRVWAELGKPRFDFTDVERDERTQPNGSRYRLYNAAHRYVRSYTGTLPFLISVKNQRRKLTPKQVAGVLNCIVSAERKKLESTVKPTSLRSFGPALDDDDRAYEAWLDYQASKVSKGTYTVVLPLVGDRVTVRLGPWRADKYNPGKRMRWISFRQGAGYTLYAKQGEGEQHRVLPKMRGTNGRVNSALIFLLEDETVAAEARLAYALESGRCSRCDRELTVPASIHQGLGPECIKYVKG